MKRLIRLAAAAALVGAQIFIPGAASAQPRAADTKQNCQLGNGIQHVVSITFDNTHLFPDRPGVPSDLEQMPNSRGELGVAEGSATASGHLHCHPE